MKLNKKQEILLDSIVDQKLDILLLENEYLNYQREVLSRYGVRSPFQLPPEKRAQFWMEVKTGWAKHPKNKINMQQPAPQVPQA